MSSDLNFPSVFTHVLEEGTLTDMLKSQLLAPREPPRQGRYPSASSIRASGSGFFGGSQGQSHLGRNWWNWLGVPVKQGEALELAA